MNRTSAMTEQKVVLVTGCAKGGIGYEYCKAFAESHCQVFASDIATRLPDLMGISPLVEPLELDVTSDLSVKKAVAEVAEATGGRIDVLVNNAGVGGTGPLAEIALEEVQRTWEVNALGQLRLVQAVAPYMVARRSGRIVNVGSVVGSVATPWAGPYCASKAAVHSMSDTLRMELKPFGVHVVLVVPGAVRSNFGSANVARLSGQDWRMYGEFKEAIVDRARASQVGGAMDARLFARQVARKVLSSNPPKRIAFGHMTVLFAALAWSPIWAREMFLSKRFNLNMKV